MVGQGIPIKRNSSPFVNSHSKSPVKSIVVSSRNHRKHKRRSDSSHSMRDLSKSPTQ